MRCVESNALEDIMATLTDAEISRSHPNVGTKVRTGGTWLALGSVLLIVGIALHPLPSADPAEFMATIADSPTRWAAAHAATAVGMGVFAIAALIVLTTDSELTKTWWTTTAWAALIVAALWVATAAIVEGTVVTQAAVAGDMATYTVWSSFAVPYSAAFLVFALAIAVIAGTDARRTNHTTPVWASWIGVLAAVVAVVGMVLAFGAGIALAGLVWLGATIVMGLWTLWAGIVLARAGEAVWAESEETDTGGPEAAH